MRAHPRSRGENRGLGVGESRGYGSSPLTRGKRHVALISSLACGLIPAHAGKTMRSRCLHRGSGAHPRSRGENARSENQGDAPDGSSPLTRGKPDTRARHYGTQRLIPAHAGKTCKLSGRDTHHTAHPRSRGENGTRHNQRAVHAGSSPLTRGKRSGRHDAAGRRGLIPAHAGKTSTVSSRFRA